MSESKKTPLVIVFGGQSPEHKISCITAAHIYANLDKSTYDAHLVGITKDGDFVSAEPQENELVAEGSPIDFLKLLKASDDTVAFPVLHGPLGEDGTIQGLFDIAGVAYVGADVLSSAVAMDKRVCKLLLEHYGVAQSKWKSFLEPEFRFNADKIVESCIDDLGLPLFVKPANMGSSIGISRAKTKEEVAEAFEVAYKYDTVVVVEEEIVGREIEFAVLGNENPKVSTGGEILPGAEFYDYNDKYFDGKSTSVIPADISDDAMTEMQRIAGFAYTSLGLSGLSRADFLYEEDGRGALLNEFNTIPGFTPISMYPKLWDHDGIAYADLLDELVRLAQQRFKTVSAKRITEVE